MSLYEAGFNDADGKPFTSKFRVADDTNAKVVANAIALKSDAKWVELKKLTAITLPMMDGETDMTPNFNTAAAEGSDIQRRGRLSYATAVAGNYVAVEIPSVKSAYLAKSPLAARTTTSDPFDAPTLAMLVSENGSAATALHQAHFITRERKV